MPAVRSVTAQAFSYFARSNAGGIRREPVKERYAWVGSEVMNTPELYTVELSPEQIEEVKNVVQHAASSGKKMVDLRKEHFPFDKMQAVISKVKAELTNGLGFILVRGFPAHLWSQTESECFFWGWGIHLGTCGAQDNSGELLGHVLDTGADPKVERQYKTCAAIDYHCDAAEVVGLMCLGASTEGGESKLVSSAMAYNRLLAEKPHLVDRLYDPCLLDTRGSGGIQGVDMEPARHGVDGRLRMFWHNEYFTSAYGKPGMPATMPDATREVHKAMSSIIHDDAMAVKMKLKVGDIQMCHNDSIVHARAAYADGSGSTRHLLRLWISLDEPLGWSDWLSKKWHFARVVSRFLSAKVLSNVVYAKRAPADRRAS